jgi:hypothetical protein
MLRLLNSGKELRLAARRMRKRVRRSSSYGTIIVLAVGCWMCKGNADGVAWACDDMQSGDTETRTRYQSLLVPYGSSCVSEEQTRQCDNGRWSHWSGTLTELSCAVEGNASCGATPHGALERRTRYRASSVPYGSSCVPEEQTRQCDNGLWGAWDGNYVEVVCVVEGAASCGPMPHGGIETRVRYESASVPYGSKCGTENQTRECINGVWATWKGTYINASCAVEGTASCGSIPHGGTETRTRYQSDPSGSVCTSETQARVCEDGVWGDWDGTYTAPSCAGQNATGELCTEFYGDGHCETGATMDICCISGSGCAYVFSDGTRYASSEAREARDHCRGDSGIAEVCLEYLGVGVCDNDLTLNVCCTGGNDCAYVFSDAARFADAGEAMSHCGSDGSNGPSCVEYFGVGACSDDMTMDICCGGRYCAYVFSDGTSHVRTTEAARHCVGDGGDGAACIEYYSAGDCADGVTMDICCSGNSDCAYVFSDGVTYPDAGGTLLYCRSGANVAGASAGQTEATH